MVVVGALLRHVTEDGGHVRIQISGKAQIETRRIMECDIVGHGEVDVVVLPLQPVHVIVQEAKKGARQAVSLRTGAPEVGEAGHLDNGMRQWLLATDGAEQRDDGEGDRLGQAVAPDDIGAKLR
jgi:hypothetical protein